MDKGIVSSLLAFSNSMAAELGLEDCKSILELRNLMPIVANYIETGLLTFVDNPSFGFRNAVQLIAKELDEPFHSSLDPEAAERGDEFESAKTETFSTICEKLSPEHHNRVADMVAFLDDRQRWTSAQWPRLLCVEGKSGQQQQQQPPADNNKENTADKEENTADDNDGDLTNLSTPPRSMYMSAFGRNLFNTGSRLRSPSRYRRYKDASPSTFTARKIEWGKGSPIAKVVDSPRGQEVVRIHALEKELKQMRELRDIFGQEKDQAEEICQQKEQENQELKKQIETLQARLALVLPRAERVPRLEDQLLDMEQQNMALTKGLKEAQARASNAQEHCGHLQFELQKMEIKQSELEHLREECGKAVKKAKDEMDSHDLTRKKLLNVECQYSKQLAEAKSAKRELEIRLHETVQEFGSRIDQKNREISAHYELVNECKARAEDNVQEAQSKTAERERELEARVKELTECRQTLHEFSEIAQQQKTVIQDQDRQQKKLEEERQAVIGELNALREHHQKREWEWTAELDKLQKEMNEQKLNMSKLARSHFAEATKLQKRIDALERELFAVKTEHQREIADLKNKLQAITGERDQYRQQILELEATIISLRQELKAAQRKLSEKNEATITSRHEARNRLVRTPSMAVTFKPSQCSSSSNFQRSSTATASSAGSVTDMNHDERLRELRERNRRNPPHLRSNYLPEAAHLKNSIANLDVFPE